MEWSCIEDLLRVTREEALWTHCRRFAKAHGFDHFAFVRKSMSGHEGMCVLTRHDYTNEWAQRFENLKRPDVERTDPIVRHILAEQPATAWSCRGDITITRPDIGGHARRAVLPNLSEFGIRAGLTIPLPSRGGGWSYMGLTTVDTSDARELLPLIASAHTFAHFVYATLRRLEGRGLHIALTPRERQVLQWAGQGKSSWEISRILAISERTVNFHIENAIRRLGVRGRRAAVARALALGAIDW